MNRYKKDRLRQTLYLQSERHGALNRTKILYQRLRLVLNQQVARLKF